MLYEVITSEFQQQLKAGRVKEIVVYENRIEGAFSQPTASGHTRFVTIRVDPDLARDLEGYNVKYGGALEHRITSYNVCYTKLLRISRSLSVTRCSW